MESVDLRHFMNGFLNATSNNLIDPSGLIVEVSLLKAGQDIVKIINRLGGDFELTIIAFNEIKIKNQSQCAGRTHKEVQNPFEACNILNDILIHTIDRVNPDIVGGFVQCSCDHDSSCEIILGLYS